MRTILLSSIAALAMTAGATAQETEGQGYLGAGVAVVNLDTGIGDVNLGGISFVGGYDLSDYFGIEAEGVIGVTDDELLNVDVSLNYTLIGYLVGRVPVGENGSNLFARVGYGTAEAEVANNSVTSDGFAWGVGGEWSGDGANFIRVNATWLDEDSLQYGASYVRRF